MSKRIVVEPSGYACLNMGDVAMMQVAVARLGELWPHAAIEVVTARQDLLQGYCPSVVPLAAGARGDWLSGRSLIGRFHRRLPAKISASLQELEKLLWLRCPALTDLAVSLKARVAHRRVASSSSFRKQLTGADLMVVTGMGGFNDAFGEHACSLLDELEAVSQAGVPIVAFGQGIGPITDPALLAKARAVLPLFKLISLREGHTGLPFLQSIGIPKDRIYVTGDDAIELAYQRRCCTPGKLIGINLRLASYAGTGKDIVDMLLPALRLAAQSLNSSLVPVPISFHDEDSDVETLEKLLNGYSHGSQAPIGSPADVIDRIGNCRVVVTGSYHAGVFALAQGIPVVGLLQSAYYEQKFIGLQKQFPGGCRIIDFRHTTTASSIQETICSAWKSAEQVRAPLLKAAARQVELSREAYRTAYRLFPLPPGN